MTLYTSNPSIAGAGAATDGPINLGVRFKVVNPNCYLAGFRFYYSNWAPTLSVRPKAALYEVGSSTQLVAPLDLQLPFTAFPDVIGGYSARNVLDPSTANRWLAAKPSVGSPAWLSVYSDDEQEMTDYRITPYTVATAPKDFTLEGSNDGGSTWSMLDTRVGVVWSNTNEKTFAIASPQPFQKYRLSITANNGDATYLAIVCLKFTGYTVTSPGWATAWLPSWFALTENVEYRATFNFQTSRPSSTIVLGSASLVNGPLTVTSPHTYAYGAAFANPTGSAGSQTNYLLDVMVSDSPQPVDTGITGIILGSSIAAALKIGSNDVSRIYFEGVTVWSTD